MNGVAERELLERVARLEADNRMLRARLGLGDGASVPRQPHDGLVVVAAGRHLVWPLSHVSEVVAAVAVAPLDGAARWVAGTVDLRGEPAVAVDVAARLAVAAASPPRVDQTMVVARVGRRPFCLIVDDVEGVARVDPAGLEPAEAVAREPWVVGVLTRAGRTPVTVVDLVSLLVDAEGA